MVKAALKHAASEILGGGGDFEAKSPLSRRLSVMKKNWAKLGMFISFGKFFRFAMGHDEKTLWDLQVHVDSHFADDVERKESDG